MQCMCKPEGGTHASHKSAKSVKRARLTVREEKQPVHMLATGMGNKGTLNYLERQTEIYKAQAHIGLLQKTKMSFPYCLIDATVKWIPVEF